MPRAAGQNKSKKTPTFGNPGILKSRVAHARTVVTANTRIEVIAESSKYARSDAHGSYWRSAIAVINHVSNATNVKEKSSGGNDEAPDKNVEAISAETINSKSTRKLTLATVPAATLPNNEFIRCCRFLPVTSCSGPPSGPNQFHNAARCANLAFFMSYIPCLQHANQRLQPMSPFSYIRFFLPG